MSAEVVDWVAAIGGWAGALVAAAAVGWAVLESRRRDQRDEREQRRRRNRALAAVVADLDALCEFIDEKLPATGSRFPQFDLISLGAAVEHFATLPPECSRALLRVHHRLAAYNASAAGGPRQTARGEPMERRRGQLLQREAEAAKNLLAQHLLDPEGP